MDLFDLDNDLDGEFLMNYTGNRTNNIFIEFLGEFGYMGTLNNDAFYVQKKCFKNGCKAVEDVKWYFVIIHKDWKGPDKNHWLGTVKYFSFIS